MGCKFKAARSSGSGRCRSIPRFPGTAKGNRTCLGCLGRAAPRTSQPRPPAQLRRGPRDGRCPFCGERGGCLAWRGLAAWPAPPFLPSRRSQAERGQNEGVGSFGAAQLRAEVHLEPERAGWRRNPRGFAQISPAGWEQPGAEHVCADPAASSAPHPPTHPPSFPASTCGSPTFPRGFVRPGTSCLLVSSRFSPTSLLLSRVHASAALQAPRP